MKIVSLNKKYFILLLGIFLFVHSYSSTHKILVWSGYFSFLNEAAFTNILAAPITIQLGDTIQFLPYDPPTMMHTITSTIIPVGAAPFNQVWGLPADTFFQYVPAVAGVYNFECTPHVSMNMIGAFTVVSGNVGVKNMKSSATVSAFPIPAVNQIQLKSDASLLNKNYKVYNSTGMLMQTGIIDLSNTWVNVKEWAPGAYYLLIDDTAGKPIRLIKE